MLGGNLGSPLYGDVSMMDGLESPMLHNKFRGNRFHSVPLNLLSSVYSNSCFSYGAIF